jgi:hypothetical protein
MLLAQYYRPFTAMTVLEWWKDIKTAQVDGPVTELTECTISQHQDIFTYEAGVLTTIE